MSNTFDTGRFLQYFKWDLRNAYNNIGLSVLITGSLLFGAFTVAEFFALMFSGGSVAFPHAVKYAMVILAFLTAMLLFPARAYGRLTEKRYGSDWLMIPASSLEKTLSMVVIMCLVIPLCLFVMSAFWDCILSLVFPSSYGAMMLSGKAGFSGEVQKIPGWFAAHISIMSLFEMWDGMLMFTLGALCFRKSKVAKTILTYLVVASVITSAVSIIAAHNPDFFISLSCNADGFDDLREVFPSFAAVIYALDIIATAAFCGAIYYRIRTIKH